MDQKYFYAPFTGGRLDGLTRSSTVCEYTSVKDSSDMWLDISGNGRHLLPNQNPPHVYSGSTGQDGNTFGAISFNGTTNRYAINPYDEIKIWDSDHTVTILALIDSAAGGLDTFMAQGGLSGGIIIDTNISAQAVRARYNDSVASEVKVSSNSAPWSLNVWQIIQVVRNSDMAKIGINGVFGNSKDVTGVGTDQSITMDIGRISASSNYLKGKVAYVRVDNVALTDEELQIDRDKIRGIASPSKETSLNWNITRAGSSYTQIAENQFAEECANQIQASPQGIEVNNTITNVCKLSDRFNDWAQFGTCPVTANVDTGVRIHDGLYADLLDNTTGSNTHRRFVTTDNLGDLTGKTYFASVVLWADTPHICSIFLGETGVGGVVVKDIFVGKKPKRYFTSRLCTGGGAGTLDFGLVPGQFGVATGACYASDGLIAESKFDYGIPIPTPVATTATRNADVINAEIPQEMQEIGNSNHYKKITINLDVKCRFASSLTTTKKVIYFEASYNQASQNKISIYSDTDGKIYADCYDSSSTLHRANTNADSVSLDDWVNLDFHVDFSDLTNLELLVNNVSAGNYTGNSGTANIDLTDSNNRIKLGTDHASTEYGDYRIRNLRIQVSD